MFVSPRSANPALHTLVEILSKEHECGKPGTTFILDVKSRSIKFVLREWSHQKICPPTPCHGLATTAATSIARRRHSVIVGDG